MTTQPTSRLTLSDQRMDTLIGLLLRTGVLLASLVVLAGGVLHLIHNPHTRPTYRSFSAEPATLTHITHIATGAASANPAALIQLGLLLLIATPIARVLFAAVAFALQRDWLYTLISAIILAVLLLSFFLMH